MPLQKLFAFFCFISLGFSAYDAIPFRNLDVKLAEAGVPQELLPMNHHTAAQRVKNVRFIFGVGRNLSFYSYPKAVNFNKLLFPQNSTAAFVQMLFPNPHMFAANQSPDAIAGISFKNLGLLARHLVSGDYDAAIDTFENAISPGTNSSSSSSSFDEVSLLEFQRMSFYQEIRRQTQEQFDAMFDEDDDSEFFKDTHEDKRIAHVIMEKWPELLPDAADLLESGFFDNRSKPAVPENLQKLQNETFVFTLQKAIAEAVSGTTIYTIGMLVEAINTFAWQKFKSTVDILDYYKGITGNEELDLDFEQFSFEQIRTAAKQLEEDKCFDDLPQHFRTAIVKYTLIQAAPPFSGVRYRSATYIDPTSRRRTQLGFADCVESQARAFFNGVTHQCTELGICFNPNLLPASAPVRLFYQEFSSPEHISIQPAHGAFATLVAKLPGVKYATPKNQRDISKRVAEVWAGNLNLVKVLCHMSGCYLQLKQVFAGITPENAQNCLENALLLLSTHLSRDGFTLEFDCDSYTGTDLTYDRTLEDITGDILGKVNDEDAFLLKSNSGHGELKPLVKQKPTWLNDLPTEGPEFEALPDDLKHYVYMGMSSEILATLAPELQRTIILSSVLDDIDTQIDRSIHCFSQSNPLVRELALPIAHNIVAEDDGHSTSDFVTELFSLIIRGKPNCLTEHEFKALCHDNFLNASYARFITEVMTAYGYKKDWLTEASLNSKHEFGPNKWDAVHQYFDVTPFSNEDYVNILKICTNLKHLDFDLPKDHTSASQFVSAIAHLSKLISLKINLSDHTASNPLFTQIYKLPKSLETLNMLGQVFHKSAQSVLIEAAVDCINYLPALKHLSMTVENEEMLRSVLSIFRTAALPTERIAINYPAGEDWQTHRTRVSGIYQEVLGHEYPENH